MSDWKKLIIKNGKIIILLAIIIFVGVLLRTYKFHEWLRFSHDQARDAWIISSALKGNRSLPLLGPNAGVTAFQLGPAYYYLSYASEKIFGNYPDKMAYPSLFFSILSIPLIFLLLREYFEKYISLAMAAIASVSYFLVINSRFSSNPNLITFFVLLYLYSILKILNDEENHYFIWGILAGLSLGVGVQLHTTLLISMPAVSVCVFAYLFFKNKSAHLWKIAAVILAVFLVVNTSQIYHELKSGGKNSLLFLKGFKSSSGKSNFGEKIFFISACQIQANSHILSSLQDDDRCNTIYNSISKNKSAILYTGYALSVLFSLAGYWLLFVNWFREKEKKKKNFLGLVILFNAISFLILVPIANIIYVGYFINLFFIPFILLGMILQYVRKKYGKMGFRASWAIITILIASCLIRDGMKAQSYFAGLENNSENSTLGQVEMMSQFVLDNSPSSNKIYFSGQDDIMGRFYYPIEYFAKKSGKKLEKIDLDFIENSEIEPGSPIFFIEDSNLEKTGIDEVRNGLEIISSRKFERQTILLLRYE